MQIKSTLKKIRQVLKTTAVAAVALTLFSGLANAQTYTNGNLSTGATLSTGAAAPAGTTWSELQLTNTSLGTGVNVTAGFSVADDFIVPTGPSWNLTKATFYAYSTGYAGATSPFNDVRFQIFTSNPSVGSPTPIYGDLTTNRFGSSVFANMYRTSSTAGTTRKIWEINANISVTLAPGTYWIEWQLGNGGLSNFSPLSTVVGTITQAGNNATQNDKNAGTWTPLEDSGTPQDMPFKLAYTTGACAGTPDVGNTISTAASVCPLTPFTLSLQNTTSGSGVTYQWQTSATMAGPYTDISGASNATYTVSDLPANAYYQAIVTCSGASDTSTPVMVSLNPPSACYCIPPSSNCDLGDAITNVSIGILNNSSDCSASGGYTNYTTNPSIVIPKVFIGVGNKMSVTVGDGGTEHVAVWIDYNRNGSFEVSEFTALGSGSDAAVTGTINVPAGVDTGLVRMRVRVRWSTALTGTGSCLAYSYGETEDYTVNLQPCVSISLTSQPQAATTTCGGNTSFIVKTTGSLPSYYWQYRVTPTSTWLNVVASSVFSGVNTDTLRITSAPTSINGYEFRAVYQGACSGADFSNFAKLTVNPAAAVVVAPTSASICKGSLQKLSITTVQAGTSSFTENFDVADPLPSGWAQKNNSLSPAGGYFQGNPAAMSAYNGAPNAYIGVNYQSGIDNLSNWLFTPTLSNLNNGDSMTFYSRIPDGTEYPDRLEVRLSTNGSSTNVGSSVTSVGDFTTLLLTINPTLTTGVYPKTWTKFKVVVSGLAAPVTGRFAFRYYVTDDGSGTNANYVGIDNVVFSQPAVAGNGVWSGPASTIFTDAAGTIAYNGTSMVNTVYVKPDTTSNYTVVFTNSNGCVSPPKVIPVTVNLGFATGATSTTTNQATCLDGNASFTASIPAGAAGVQHQWKVSTDNGATYTNVANGGIYSGATTATLVLTGVTAANNNYRFKDSLYVTSCASFILSNAATLKVNPNPAIVISASPSAELLPNTTTTLTATVSPNPGATYKWFKNGVLVAGATTSSLVVGIDDLGDYTVKVNDVNTCGGTSNSITVSAKQSDMLFIYPSPNTGKFMVRYFSPQSNLRSQRILNIYDSKGTKVFSKPYAIGAPYSQMNVDLTYFSKGLYTIEIFDRFGKRIKTGRVIVQ